MVSVWELNISQLEFIQFWMLIRSDVSSAHIQSSQQLLKQKPDNINGFIDEVVDKIKRKLDEM